MDNFAEIINSLPQEFLMILGGILISLFTQISKKVRDRFNYQIDPKTIAALFAIIGGIIYAIIINVAPNDYLEKVTKFAALSFSGAVSFYELYKTMVKKEDKKLKFNNNYLEDLIITERRARLVGINFESFNLEELKVGKKNTAELINHLDSLKQVIEQKVSINKEFNHFSIGEK